MVDILESIFGSAILQEHSDEWGVVPAKEPVGMIAAATTLSPAVIQSALDVGANLIVTHHDSWTFMYEHRARAHEMLREYGMGLIWCHYPLDVAPFGPGVSLLKSLGCSLIGDSTQGGLGVGDLPVRLAPLSRPRDDQKK